MMRLPGRLLFCDLGGRQQLQDTYILRCGQRRRSTGCFWVDRAGAQAPWPVHPISSVLGSSHGERSGGRNRCSSSGWKRSSTNANASGDARTIVQLWEEYFRDPSQWWDNRIDKRNPRSPDFKQKVTSKALWVDGWSTPSWAKAMLEPVTANKMQPHVCYLTRGSQGTGGPNRPPRNIAIANLRPTGMRESRQIVHVTNASMHMHENSINEVCALLKNQIQHRVTIDSFTFVEVLQRCFKQQDLELIKQVHDCIRKSGMEQNVYVANNLLRVYIRCGRLQDAQQVFDKLVNKDVFSWTIMIGGHVQHDRVEVAMEVYNEMCQDGAQPNKITYLSILKACASTAALKWGKEVHAHIRRCGYDSDVRVGTALIKMYAKCGNIKEAKGVFDKLTYHDVISWTAIIGAYTESGCGVEAYQLFIQMQQEGCVPNAFTYVSILNACASAGALEWVKEVHSHALEAGFESNLRVGNSLVHMYSKSGSIDDARLVFDRMVERDVFTWSVMIGGLAEHGFGYEALQLFEQMSAEGVKPDGCSFVAVLSACSHAGLVDDGRRQFLAMTQDYGIEPTVVHYTCVVDLLGRAGLLDEAMLFIHNMPLEPDVATWGALLGACRTYGNVELAELAAEECLKLEPKDASIYVLLSNIYAAAGKWNLVTCVRNMMQERGIRKEPGHSWIEVDNMIHHFVVGDTSHPEAKEIYAELNMLTEKLKVEGYIPDTRLVLHNITEEDKELALCSHSEKLAIAYGLLHTPIGKPIHIYKNLRVCSDCHTATKFISKVTGREIVARDANRFHHFKDGVCSCADYW